MLFHTRQSLSRRELFTGVSESSSEPVIRPPWSVPESEFSECCTSCHACIDACPEQILKATPKSQPFVDFSEGECTFCGACVEACPSNVFEDNPQGKPWAWIASVSDICLGRNRIICQSCGDVCEPHAIRFSVFGRKVSVPQMSEELCTGCGACVSVCPVDAIQMRLPDSNNVGHSL